MVLLSPSLSSRQIPDNKQLVREFNGKSGLAYADKLFLFISPQNTATEIRAILTHEYNHVCRLNKFPKREEDCTLLDTIILEGLAEMAVAERFGKDFTSSWTSLYSDRQLARFWKEFVYPNRNQVKESDIHEEVLYGLRSLSTYDRIRCRLLCSPELPEGYRLAFGGFIQTPVKRDCTTILIGKGAHVYVHLLSSVGIKAPPLIEVTLYKQMHRCVCPP